MTTLGGLQNSVGESRQLALGRVSRVIGTSVWATAKSFGRGHEFGPMPFAQASSVAVGDAVLIALDEDGGAWISGWKGTADNYLQSNGLGTFTLSAPAAADTWGYLNIVGGTSGNTGAGISFRPTAGSSVGSYEIYAENGGGIDAMRIFSNADSVDILRFSRATGGASKPGIEFGNLADTKMWRAAAGTIETSGTINTAGFVQAFAWSGGTVCLGWDGAASGSAISFGSGYDANIRRTAAATLRTNSALTVDGVLTASSGISVPTGQGISSVGYLVLRSGATNDQIVFYNASSVELGRFDTSGDFELGTHKLQFGTWAAPDTNLYRSSANVLATDDNLSVLGGSIYGPASEALAVMTVSDHWVNTRVLRSLSTVADGMYIGYASSGGDVRIYGNSETANPVTVETAGRLQWGGDTNLYRAAANLLMTDDTFATPVDIVANRLASGQIWLNTDGNIYFGSAADTNLYRSAADTLKTDDSLIVAGTTTLTGVATGPTAAAGTNTTQLATTAFVRADVSAYDIFDVQQVRGTNPAYQVPTFTSSIATIYKTGQTAGQEMKLSITPAYDCWWEIAYMIGLMQKTDANYHYGNVQLTFNTAPVVPSTAVVSVAPYQTQHSTVQQFMGYSGTALVELAAGTAYTVTIKFFEAGGTWQYYQGDQQLWMTAKAIRKP